MTPRVFSKGNKVIPTKELLQGLESHAIEIRRKAGVDLISTFDVFNLTKALNIVITFPQNVQGMTPENIAEVSSMSASIWSGMANKLPDDKLLIILNPNQTRERMHVTVLEDVAHNYYGHIPSKIHTESNGLQKREYEEHKEIEAYWTAASVLLPSKIIGHSVWNNQTVEEVSKKYGASQELVEMRIKLLGLWSEYCGRSRKSAA